MKTTKAKVDINWERTISDDNKLQAYLEFKKHQAELGEMKSLVEFKDSQS